MRAAILIRSGSISPVTDIFGLSSRSSAFGHEAAVSFYRRSQNTRMSLDVRERKDSASTEGNLNPLRRVRSDTDLIGFCPQSSCGTRWSLPAMFDESEENDLIAGVWRGASAPALKEGDERVEYSGGGNGKGKKNVGGGGDRGGDGRNSGDRGIGNYYQEMLRADPGNPLFLRNYARFLHEVEEDFKKAEEYYGRAILASPADGEVLSLYAQLIWEFQRDFKRAKTYHERAVKASPADCSVLGSYAHFLWDAEEREEAERASSSSPLVEAF